MKKILSIVLTIIILIIVITFLYLDLYKGYILQDILLIFAGSIVLGIISHILGIGTRGGNYRNFMIIIIFFSFSVSFAQTNIETKNEKFKVPRVYVGVLNTSAFSLENTGVSSSASLRIGGELSYQLSSKLSLNSFIANEISKDKNLSIANYYLKYQISDNINLQIGQVATPATLFRPHPVSADGQFESWSTSQLPGGGFGATFSLFNSKFGVYKKGDEFEYHVYSSKNNLTVGMWYNSDGTLGSVWKYKGKRIQTNFSFIKTKKKISVPILRTVSYCDEILIMHEDALSKEINIKINNLSVYTLDKEKKSLFLYSDIGYATEANEILHLQVGVLKYLSTKYMKCTIGGAYDYTSQSFNGYLQFNL